MPYSDQQMQQAAATLEEASLKVRTGLLLIGERHTEPHGRGLVANLIQRRLVDDLFLEIPGNGLEGADMGSPAWLASNLNKDLTKDPQWESDKFTFNGTYQNLVPFSRLIEFALSQGVRVHFIDYKPGYGEEAVSPKDRSKLMRKKLDEWGAGPRSVFLVGSVHLGHVGLRDRPNVQMVKCIGT